MNRTLWTRTFGFCSGSPGSPGPWPPEPKPNRTPASLITWTFCSDHILASFVCQLPSTLCLRNLHDNAAKSSFGVVPLANWVWVGSDGTVLSWQGGVLTVARQSVSVTISTSYRCIRKTQIFLRPLFGLINVWCLTLVLKCLLPSDICPFCLTFVYSKKSAIL